MKIAAFGDNCVDYYRNLDRYYLTGNVIDFGVHMQLMGYDTSAITITGNDSYGDELIQELSQLGLNVSHIHQREGKTPFVTLDLIDGERTYTSFEEGVMEHAAFTREDVLFVKEHKLAHFGVWGHADEWIRELQEAGVMISYDFATEKEHPKVKEIAPFLDYAFFSFENKDKEAQEFLKDIVAAGTKMAVATFGDEGSLAWDGTCLYEYGIKKVETVVNTVGAGDSFIAGFMSGVLSNKTTRECLERGAELAAKVIQKFHPW